jgi:predicted RND superfamily exporter protein
MLDLSSQESLDLTRIRLEDDPFFSRTLLSKDKKYVLSIILLDPAIANLRARNEVCARISTTLSHSRHPVVLSGIPYIRSQLVEKIQSELIIFLGSSCLLVVFFLFLIYRTLWGVMIPVLAVVGALIWCLGFMGLLGTHIDIINNLIPPIMFVVGMGDVIHLITKYTQELKLGKDKQSAMQTTLSNIGSSILLTSLTTAIGFGSLLSSNMMPLRSFGFFAAAGVMFAYLIAVVLVPNALLALDVEKLKRSKGIGEMRFWDPMLSKIDSVSRRYPRRIVLGFAVLVTVSLAGLWRVSLDAYLVDDLRKGDSVRKGLDFFQDEFNGIRSLDLAILPAEGKEVTDLEILREMEKIEDFLNERAEFGPFLSLVSFLKSANRMMKFNSMTQYRLPGSQEKVEDLLGMAYSSGGTSLLHLVMTEDRKMGRINAQMDDIGTDRFSLLKADLDAFVASNCNTDNFSFRLTGNTYIFTLNIGHLHASLFYGLGFAFLVIGMLMGGIFKSFKMVVIALVPNVIPLLLTAGLMGWTGISLKVSNSVVFVISFGIAVDVTIHFLSRLQIELRKKPDLDPAIHRTIMGTGKALILTSAMIICGFVLFLFSQIGGTFAIGLFVTVTLAVGLVSNLLLMPVILRRAFRKEYPTIGAEEAAD